MTNISTLRAASRTTTAILSLILTRFRNSNPERVTDGLPAGSLFLPEQQLILAGTPCTVPLFRDAMIRAALKMNADVLVVRHGAYPETLDVTIWDAAIRSGKGLVSLHDLVLYVNRHEEHWFVPPRDGAFVRVAADGLHIEAEPPFLTWHERCDAVCGAAKRIIHATRGSSER
jgi:hypothetical protein